MSLTNAPELVDVNGKPEQLPITSTGSLPVLVMNLPVTQSVFVANGIFITSGTGSLATQVQGLVPSGTTQSGNPVFMGGVDSTGTVRAIMTDGLGRIITAPAGTSTTINGFADGHVTTTGTTLSAVRGTTYTEQPANAQRSIVSTSVADTNVGGTGARKILLVYYDQTGAGPFSETLFLSGTVAGNSINTNICFIESMTVAFVGSGGANVGTISLKATVAGGGATVWSINPGDNQTFGAHHYTPSGKTTFITGISCGHNGTTAGSGGLFIIKSLPISGSNNVEIQVSDEPRLYGQSSTFTRIYGTPVKISGPARTTVYVTPETATSTTYRSAFDFYDQ